MDLSLYGGTGIIGTYFKGLYGCSNIPRDQLEPLGDEILYLISTTDNTTFKENPFVDVDTNLVQLLHRLEACRRVGIKTFNFVSSWFVYGSGYSCPNEEAICDPKGFYSVTKYAAEKLCRTYCTAHGINYRILRLGNVYGHDGYGDYRRHALHYLIRQLKWDRDINVYINLSRDYIHILDTCRAIDLICKQGTLNSTYNIGTGIATRLGDCLDQAKDLLKSKGCVLRSNVPCDYDQAIRFSLDCGRLFRLGFEPQIAIQQGITDLCLNRKFCTPDPTLMEQK
jgi:nucleoside-diphosphate-sugar epimerase